MLARCASFSATLPSWVEGVAKKYLRKGTDCKRVDLVGEQSSKASHVRSTTGVLHWSQTSGGIARM